MEARLVEEAACAGHHDPDGVYHWTSSPGRIYITLPCLTDVISDLTLTTGPLWLPGRSG